MDFLEKLQARGTVRLYDTDTGELLKTVHNLVVTDGQALTGRLLINSSGYTVGLSYCALGTDGTPPAAGQHTLVSEESRAQITQKTISSNTITVSTFFTAANCTLAILETGLFGHNASLTPDSGVMFARALLSYDNSSSPRNLTISWDVEIQAGA